jgi:hypothetical protein
LRVCEVSCKAPPDRYGDYFKFKNCMMGNLYYNRTTDKAFRVESERFETVWYKEVSTHGGRAKMNANQQFMASDKLKELIKAGDVIKLNNSKTITRDINHIRAGIPLVEDVKPGKKAFTFKVGSLIDEHPEDYVAICNQHGYIIGHEYKGQKLLLEIQEEECKPEVKDDSQLSMF